MDGSNLPENEKAAIIGFWRSGASLEHIIAITGITYWEIEKLIEEHKRKTK